MTASDFMHIHCGFFLRVGGHPHMPRRRPGGRWRLAQLSWAICSKAYRNIPRNEADESSIDEIRVLDPRHPLYGRSFRVIRRSAHRGGNFPLSYEVEHRNGSSLLIPIAATEWHEPSNIRPKLSIESLRDLVSAVDSLDSDDEHKPKRSLGNAVAKPEAAGCRRHRRGLGGGAS